MKTRKLQLPEERLVQLLQEQHPDGIKAIYDMYSAALFGVISRIIPDHAVREDVLQETFIRIWRSFGQYEAGKGRLFTWMVNIARNLAIDQLRSKGYQKGRQTEELDACEQLSCSSDTSIRIDQRLIREGVARLRQNELDVIGLVYYKGYTHLEAAEVLQLPLGTVKTRISNALRRLRSYYNGYELMSA